MLFHSNCKHTLELYNKWNKKGDSVMLDQKDLEVLQKMMESVVDSRITESEERMISRMDSRIAESEKRMISRMDSRIAESENLLLEEMDRLETKLTTRIDKIDKRLDSLQHDVNACKLEAGTLELLEKRIDRLETINFSQSGIFS